MDYPIFLNLSGKLVLVVGGGAVAARKAARLLQSGARVRVVSPRFAAALESPARSNLELIRRPFRRGDVKGAALVFACTDDAASNSAVAAVARRMNIPVSRADDAGDCDFTLPAVHSAGPIGIAVSTGGSPALSAAVRRWLESNLPGEFAKLARELAKLRPTVRRRLAAQPRRASLWRKLSSPASLSRLRRDGSGPWRKWAADAITQAAAANCDRKGR